MARPCLLILPAAVFDLQAQTMMRQEGLFVGQKKGGPVPPPRPGTLPGERPRGLLRGCEGGDK